MLRSFLNNFLEAFTSVKDKHNVHVDKLLNRSKFWSTKCVDLINYVLDVHAEIVHEMLNSYYYRFSDVHIRNTASFSYGSQHDTVVKSTVLRV